MKTLLERYPFRTVLSLEPLITALRRDCETISETCGALLEKIEQTEELRGPIKDLSVLDRHQDLLRELLHQVVSALSWQSEAVETYQAALDPQVGTVYSLRKDFENSMALLNDRLCTFLDQEEAALQQLVPHYFERNRRGAEILPAGSFGHRPAHSHPEQSDLHPLQVR